MSRPLLLAGLDLVAPRLPDDAAVLRLPPRGPALADLRAAVAAAVEQPVAGAPLSSRVGPRSRVLLVVEPPAHLVPHGEAKPLRLALAAVLEVLHRRGVTNANVRLLVANGLGHQPAMTGLTPALGLEHTGGYAVATFDAEAHRGHRELAGQELASALGEADLIVDLSVRAHGSRPPLSNLVEGLATYRGLRGVHAPGLDGTAERDSRARALAKALPIFSLAMVLNGAVLTPAFASALASDGLGPAARAWNRLPKLVQRRMLAAWRSASAVTAVASGDPLEAEARAEKSVAFRVPEGKPLDVLVIPVPDLGPEMPQARSNPVLAAHLGLVTLLGSARHRLREGGAVVLLNPLDEQIDRGLHLPYAEFYERALRLASTGDELAKRFEVEFSGRPELVAAYRRKHAVHGAHPFHRWYELEQARKGLTVFVAGAGAAAAQRIGLEPADDLDDALARAARALGAASPRVGVLDTLAVGPGLFGSTAIGPPSARG